VSDIFISHAEEDRTRVVPLGPALEARGWSLFWAHGIPARRNWRDVIDAELAQTKCMIVIWSKTSIRSSWVRDEAEDGQKRGILVPARIDLVNPPVGFRSLQTADLIDWDGQASAPAFRLLIDGIEGVIESRQQEVRAREPSTEQRTAERQTPQTVAAGQVEKSQPRSAKKRRKMSVDAVRALADRTGVGPLVGRILGTATDMQLYLRPYRTSVMVTPPNNRNRMLFTVWGEGKDGKVQVCVGHSPFAEHFPVTKRTVARFLGKEGWRWLDSRDIKALTIGLRDLMTWIGTRDAEKFAADSDRAQRAWETRRREAARATKMAKSSDRRKAPSI